MVFSQNSIEAREPEDFDGVREEIRMQMIMSDTGKKNGARLVAPP